MHDTMDLGQPKRLISRSGKSAMKPDMGWTGWCHRVGVSGCCTEVFGERNGAPQGTEEPTKEAWGSDDVIRGGSMI